MGQGIPIEAESVADFPHIISAATPGCLPLATAQLHNSSSQAPALTLSNRN